MTGSQRIRTAVVGLGGVGRVHARVLQALPEAELVGVCDSLPDTARLIQTEAPFFTQYEEMLQEARPRAVVLATPPATHLPLAGAAARRGIHVLVEKPMAASVHAAQGMIEACARAGVVLMVGQKKRFVPALARLKELIDGELGPAQYVLYRYTHPGRSEKPWFWREEDGGGPLRENAIHAADTLRWLCGEVERIQGEGDYFTFEDRAPMFNCAVLTLRFVTGAIGALGAGMVGHPALPEESLYLTTERGVAEVCGRFDNPASLRWALRGEAEARTESFEGDPFERQMRHFLQCVRTGAEPLTGGREGLRSLTLCESWRHLLRRPCRTA